MANVIKTHDMLAERFLYDLSNQMTFTRNVFTGYKKEFHAVGGYQKGNSVRVQLPNRYRVKDGATMDTVDIKERNTTVTVDQHKHVAVNLTAANITFDIEDISEKVFKPAVEALANKVDYDGCGEYVNIYSMVGTAGTTPSTFQVLADAGLRLDNEAISRSERVAVLSAKGHWTMAAGEMKSVFNEAIVATMVRQGFIGRFALMDFFMDQNIRSHTVGVRDTDVCAVKTTSSEGDEVLAIKGLTAGDIIAAGDIIEIESVAGVNPVSGQVWENAELRQFVCTAAGTANGSGEIASLAIAPKIYSSDADEEYLSIQTVNDLPAANDEVTIVSGDSGTSHPQNLLFHPHAFAFTCVPFGRPMSANKSVSWGQATDETLGLSITISTDWNSASFSENTRIDILYGWDTIEPEYAVRLTG